MLRLSSLWLAGEVPAGLREERAGELPASLWELLERARHGLGDHYEDVRDRLRDRAKRFAADGRDGMF